MQEPDLKYFKKTFKHMNAIDDSSLKAMKTEKVKSGIVTGHKQTIKLSHNLLSVPSLFIELTDPKWGLVLLEHLRMS